MQDLIINAIYDLIKDKNLYNYSNNEEFKTVEVDKMTNLLNEQVIQIKIGKEYYTINCIETFREN